MEPILPTPKDTEAAPEQQMSAAASGMQASPESAPNVAAEQSREGARQAVTASVSSTQPPQDQPLQPIQQLQQTSQATDDPQIADDVDVIEKEWVDKAKRIVSATKADPHKQEKEVSKLQADYLLKRYNKQVRLGE